MAKKRTRIMRVPEPFAIKVKALSKKYGYKRQTDFLAADGVKVFSNADYINDMLGVFSRPRKQKKNER